MLFCAPLWGQLHQLLVLPKQKSCCAISWKNVTHSSTPFSPSLPPASLLSPYSETHLVAFCRTYSVPPTAVKIDTQDITTAGIMLPLFLFQLLLDTSIHGDADSW